MAFTHAGMPLRWEGKAGTLTETGIVASGELKGRTVIRVNAKYFRPAEVGTMVQGVGANEHHSPRRLGRHARRPPCMHAQGPLAHFAIVTKPSSLSGRNLSEATVRSCQRHTLQHHHADMHVHALEGMRMKTEHAERCPCRALGTCASMHASLSPLS